MHNFLLMNPISEAIETTHMIKGKHMLKCLECSTLNRALKR